MTGGITIISLAISTDKLTYITDTISEDFEIAEFDSISEYVNSIKHAMHYSYFFIDIDYFECGTDEFIKSINQLKLLNKTSVIVIAQGRTRGDKFLSDLVSMGIYNFVISVQPEVVVAELKECLTGRGLEDVEQYIIQEDQSKNKKSIFNKIIPTKKHKQVIRIAVFGVLPRIGTTTQALRICKALSSLGKQACYVECNDRGHIEIIKEVFSQAESDTENKNMVTYNGVTMFYNSTPDISKYEYVVYDYGNSPQDIECDIQIVVAGATAWELSALAERMDRDNDKTFYIFSFTDKDERDDLLDFMNTAWTRTLFADYCPDMFSAVKDSEKQEYKKLLEKLKVERE